jgi:antitoxin component YwqK of YwqJK toxin-antitoxin module
MKPTRKLIFYQGDPYPKSEHDPINYEVRFKEVATVLKKPIGKKWCYEGERIIWYESGNISSKGNWKNNKRHGKFQNFSYTGLSHDVQHFKAGVIFGQQKFL